MKKTGKLFLIILLLQICCLIPAGRSEAATAKKLFSIVVNDGFTSQTVPVYLYTEDGGTVYAAPKASMRTLSVYAGAKTVSIRVKSKSSLYKNTFISVSYKKTVALSDMNTLRFTLKKQDGSKQSAVLKLVRPSMPKITALSTNSGSAGFIPGDNNQLVIKLAVRSGVEVQAGYKIKNSKGKVVYERELQKKKNVNYTTYWGGKPSYNNPAGLPLSDYVPAGTYKVTAYIQYTVGKKTETISKTIKIKVNEKQPDETDSTQTDDTSTKNWSWNVIMTGNETVDYMAETICREVLSDNMTETARARALYQWVGNNMTHKNPSPLTSGKTYMKITGKAAKAAIAGYKQQTDALISQNKASVKTYDNYFNNSSLKPIRYNWAKSGMLYRGGDCLIMALVYSILCNHAGIEADIMENTLPSGGGGHHFWNVVRVNGTYYFADADMVTYSAGVSSYDYFLRGTKYFNKFDRYKKVRTNGGYSIVSKVSKTDCPGR